MQDGRRQRCAPQPQRLPFPLVKGASVRRPWLTDIQEDVGFGLAILPAAARSACSGDAPRVQAPCSLGSLCPSYVGARLARPAPAGWRHPNHRRT
jgi:hypothetical protein